MLPRDVEAKAPSIGDQPSFLARRVLAALRRLAFRPRANFNGNFATGAASSSRAWWLLSAGVLPSPLSVLGRSTPLTGLWVTAFFSQRYSNSDASEASRCRIVLPPSPAPCQLVAPGDDVCAGHGAEFLRPADAGEPHEVAHRVFVGAARVGVGDVGEPFDFRRHVGEALELGGSQ